MKACFNCEERKVTDDYNCHEYCVRYQAEHIRNVGIREEKLENNENFVVKYGRYITWET